MRGGGRALGSSCEGDPFLGQSQQTHNTGRLTWCHSILGGRVDNSLAFRNGLQRPLATSPQASGQHLCARLCARSWDSEENHPQLFLLRSLLVWVGWGPTKRKRVASVNQEPRWGGQRAVEGMITTWQGRAEVCHVGRALKEAWHSSCVRDSRGGHFWRMNDMREEWDPVSSVPGTGQMCNRHLPNDRRVEGRASQRGSVPCSRSHTSRLGSIRLQASNSL